MSKQRWFDRNGVELHEGDTIIDVDSGKEELVYACHPIGCTDDLNLGINASNERFLVLHPEHEREIYPFDNFPYKTVSGQRHLAFYEKVVK